MLCDAIHKRLQWSFVRKVTFLIHTATCCVNYLWIQFSTQHPLSVVEKAAALPGWTPYLGPRVHQADSYAPATSGTSIPLALWHLLSTEERGLQPVSPELYLNLKTEGARINWNVDEVSYALKMKQSEVTHLSWEAAAKDARSTDAPCGNNDCPEKSKEHVLTCQPVFPFSLLTSNIPASLPSPSSINFFFFLFQFIFIIYWVSYMTGR